MDRLILTILPFWHTSFARIAHNLANILEGTWEFEHLEDPQPELQPHHKDPTASVIAHINDPERQGKNISMYFSFYGDTWFFGYRLL